MKEVLIKPGSRRNDHSSAHKLPLWSQHKRLFMSRECLNPLKWIHTIFFWLPVQWQFLYCLESLWGDSENTKNPVLLPSCLQSFTFPGWKRVFHLGIVKVALQYGRTVLPTDLILLNPSVEWLDQNLCDFPGWGSCQDLAKILVRS